MSEDFVKSGISRIKVKWYTTIFLLMGTILAVADPVTDILTLREFYLKHHKIWFGVGLVFVIWPSLSISLMSLFFLAPRLASDDEHPWPSIIQCIIFCWNPLALAYMRLKAFILCSWNFKKLWDETIEEDCNKALNNQIKSLMFGETSCGRIEAVLESAPQFILQLHATIVLKEQVTTIQITSLCASFLSLAWTMTNSDVWFLKSAGGNLETDSTANFILTNVVLYISRLFHLSSRLLAVTFFTVGFKWWIIAVFIFDSIVMAFYKVCADTIRKTEGCDCMVIVRILSSSLVSTWMGSPAGAIGSTEKSKFLMIIKAVVFLLFPIENVTMICVYYSMEKPHEWYSVPVTVCVCVFSLVYCVMRVVRFRYLN